MSDEMKIKLMAFFMANAPEIPKESFFPEGYNRWTGDLPTRPIMDIETWRIQYAEKQMKKFEEWLSL